MPQRGYPGKDGLMILPKLLAQVGFELEGEFKRAVALFYLSSPSPSGRGGYRG